MNREPMSDSDFNLLIRALDSAKSIDESRTGMAYVTIGAFEALMNMTDEQIAILRTYLYEGD